MRPIGHGRLESLSNPEMIGTPGIHGSPAILVPFYPLGIFTVWYVFAVRPYHRSLEHLGFLCLYGFEDFGSLSSLGVTAYLATLGTLWILGLEGVMWLLEASGVLGP